MSSATIPRWQTRMLQISLTAIVLAVLAALVIAPSVLRRNMETVDTSALRSELFDLHLGIDAFSVAVDEWQDALRQGNSEDHAALQLEERSQLLLHRLGVPVVEVAPPTSLDEARKAIAQVGAALGRSEEAAAMIAAFDRELAELSRPVGPDVPTAATWGPNGYSVAGDTLAGDIMRRAGFSLVTDRLGMDTSGYVPLEVLVMAQPDLIVTGTPYPGDSRAEEVLDHPALDRLDGRVLRVPDALWTCALPRSLEALAMLSAEAEALR